MSLGPFINYKPPSIDYGSIQDYSRPPDRDGGPRPHAWEHNVGGSPMTRLLCRRCGASMAVWTAGPRRLWKVMTPREKARKLGIPDTCSETWNSEIAKSVMND